MQKKRIAIVTPYGAEPRLDNYAEFILAQSLSAEGHDVRMYTYALKQSPYYERDTVYKGVKVFRCRQRFGVSPRLLFLLITFVPHTVFCFHPRSFLNFCAYLGARVVRARLVVEIVGILHDPFIVLDVGDPQKGLKSPLVLATNFFTFLKLLVSPAWKSAWENYIFHVATAHADVIVAINKDEQNYIRKIYNRDSTLIYWCTPRTSSLVGEKPASDARIPEEFLFFIGQIKRRKGWDTAIDGLASLKHMGVARHLVFVSPQKDLREPIEYAKARGVREHITFLAAVSNEEKQWLYSHATYVLVPSTYEGFGLPVFEAFTARKPVIATDIPVFLEFLEHRRNAMLFTMGDADALAKSIRELDADPTLQKRLIEEGAKTAQEFNSARMVNEYRTLIS